MCVLLHIVDGGGACMVCVCDDDDDYWCFMATFVQVVG